MPRGPVIATLLSMLACYGTLIAVAALGALGITLSLNEGLWAAAIVGFALLALIALYLGHKRHGSLLPSLIAVLGCAILVFTFFVRYSAMTEAAGFAVLLSAVWLDWHKTRAAQSQ